MWHSLDKNGSVNVYDVEWSKGNIETNIPASTLEEVKNGVIDEVHEAHGIEGHKIDLPINERVYKSRK